MSQAQTKVKSQFKFAMPLFATAMIGFCGLPQLLFAASGQQTAGQASSGAGGASVMNVATGAALDGMCATVTPPSNIPFCIMARLSFGQASEDNDARDAADNTRNRFDSNFGNPNGPGTTTARDEFGDATDDLAKLGIKDRLSLHQYTQAKIDELNTKGFKIDPKTGNITTPGGKSFPASTFSSAQSMIDAGMSKASVEEALKITKAIADKYKVNSIGLAGGGGGGGGSSSSKSSASQFDPYASLYGSNKEKPKDAKTTGLSRTLASGESIGTQTDSIFEMISRTYKRKNAENIFVGPDNK